MNTVKRIAANKKQKAARKRDDYALICLPTNEEELLANQGNLQKRLS